MLPVRNVELTKVHYFEPTKQHRNVAIHTISQEVFDNTFNKNVIIKKNIFGHKWVLKINEVDIGTAKKKYSSRFWVYSAVFACILVTVMGSLFFTFNLEKKIFNSYGNVNNRNESDISINILPPKNFNNQSEGSIQVINEIRNRTSNPKFFNVTQEFEALYKNNATTIKNIKIYCSNCTKEQVCMKIEETSKPKCFNVVDEHDPTGCGGICLLNVEYCAVLDRKHGVFQCTPLKTLLNCPKDNFNCGEQCIPTHNVCDGVIHCKGMQDETNCDCNLDENFLCPNTTLCLPRNKKCDGLIDCWDRSDENQCHKECPSKMYRCMNGQCIPGEQFCDGITHCPDSSDEPQGCQV
ncbi:hypothetical protein WA026_023470 [Henosepilachna vigintioctopunctata]|uniref:Uncharacterized protein n=1 Tax=Henosepilachna vigintioctopunctata TaxID=420089 RepID=A0AAW1V5Y4_9CUCU